MQNPLIRGKMLDLSDSFLGISRQSPAPHETVVRDAAASQNTDRAREEIAII